MTKYFFLLVSLGLLTFLNPSSVIIEDVSWNVDYSVALEESQSNQKNVLVYFTGSDWCAPCKKLKQDLFSTSEFKSLSKAYNLVYVDIPRNQDLITAEQYEKNKALMGELNKRKVFPLLVVVNPKGEIIDDYSGYSMNGHVQYHLDFLEKNK
ncbi:thioredoxin family protein [Croceivirga thetidis]|uniref:Thioredoxin family protein n=1 Tax=Croceivirga thetidis TaxID=2721623 RepID=A0ABX1GT97_9FLAO|nr:thioredoxin family protein [Croceivirga thetidis]NKI32130.1 thioredoxin family protein [Croceivirga thetidis]